MDRDLARDDGERERPVTPGMELRRPAARASTSGGLEKLIAKIEDRIEALMKQGGPLARATPR